MDRDRSHQHQGHEGHQNCTGDHEHEELLTIEEASDLFNSLSKVDQHAQEISKVERAIISENIFSENEPFEEILPEHLKYLLLPYVRGKLHMNGQKHREHNIKLTKKYLLGYLGLCEHYEILPKIISEILDPLAKDQYKSTREQKVAMFRAAKAAESEAEEAQVKVNQLGKDSV